jgi:exonuclease 1
LESELARNLSDLPIYRKAAHREIAPAMAKRIATGDANPNTHLPIEDINPSFAPRAIKPLPLKSHDLNSSESKGKKAKKPNGASILSFFGM